LSSAYPSTVDTVPVGLEVGVGADVVLVGDGLDEGDVAVLVVDEVDVEEVVDDAMEVEEVGDDRVEVEDVVGDAVGAASVSDQPCRPATVSFAALVLEEVYTYTPICPAAVNRLDAESVAASCQAGMVVPASQARACN